MAAQVSTLCRFADQCTRRDCVFAHPSGALCPSYPQRCTNFSQCRCRHPAVRSPTTTTPTLAPTPPRQLCARGDACLALDCKLFHVGGVLCRHYKLCTPRDGRRCLFRHPSAPLPIAPSPQHTKHDAKRAPKQPTRSPLHPKPKPTFHGLVNNAIQLHDNAIRSELETLLGVAAAASQRAVGGVNAADAMTQRAMQAKLQELRDQRTVFVEVSKRLQRADGDETAKLHALKREIYRFKARLPALAKRLEIEQHLANPHTRFTVIQGQTGSGKSTQIPQYAADLPCFAGKRVICTQPRKLAATTLAARVAFEYSGGWDKAPVGGDVGFRVGGYWKASHRTRIEYVTEAVLLEMIARARREPSENPFENVGCVVVDEAHERSITCDLIMGSLKEEHAKWRHVKVAITSATIDLDLFSGFFNKAPVVEIPGRMFPVEVEYISAGGQESGVVDAAKVATVVSQCALMIQEAFPDPSDGDILCFLPGQDDVLRAKDLFEANIARRIRSSSPADRAFLERAKAHALYGKQDPEEQAQVFKKQTDRKVIFATDVAETSVTIDGVVFVVDSGLRKAMVYDPLRNMSSLKVHTISRSSALQRCGRAGRTRPGRCFRLYSKQEFDEMEIGNTAEIFQQPLTLALLTLYNVGIDPMAFHWLETPNADAIAKAKAELLYLGAVDDHRNVTALGRLVAEVQVDPKHVRLIDRAAQMGVAQVGVDLVAVLSVANIAYHRGNKNDKASKLEADKKREQLLIPEHGDVVSLFRTYRAWKVALEGPSEGLDVDEPPSPPKPELDDAAGDDDEEEDGGLMAMVANNLMKLKLSAQAAAANALQNLANNRDDNDDDEDTKSKSAAMSRADADEDDTMSVFSMGSDFSAASDGSSATSKKPKRQKNEKRARAWCVKNGVNAKAMGIAYATAKELMKTLSRAKSWTHGAVDDSSSTGDRVSDGQLRRLVASGFFLNTAVNKPIPANAPRRDGPQYFALYSEVLGAMFKGTAIHAIDKSGAALPEWILFDSILRLNATPFLLLATPIDEAWISEESPAFYDLCMKNRSKLPVATISYANLSYALLRSMFGKSFQLINKWEARLKSTLCVDRETNTLTVFCAPMHKDEIHASLEKQIDEQRKRLEKEASEEVYMGTTRAVIGNGFSIQQLLFDKEFIAITVRNLANTTDRELEKRFKAWVRAAGCSPDVVRSVDILRNGTNENASVSATIKFTNKEAASRVYEAVRGDSSGGAPGEAVTVTPFRKLADKSKDAASVTEFAGRIKLTWADGIATGDAKIFFRTAHDANTFVRNARTILQLPAAQAYAVGQMAEEVNSQNAANLPVIGRATARSPPKGKVPGKPNAGGGAPAPMAPTKREPTGEGAAFRIVFDTDKVDAMTLEQQSRLRFGVSIKGSLAPSVDEYELTELVRRTIPGVGYAKIARKPVTATVASNEMELQVRFRRMLPLLTCLDESSVHTDFVDQGTRRAGVVVFCRDLPRLNETFEMARDSPLWEELEKPHGQPIRMELEHSYTTTLHSDLFRCFRDQIAQIITYARAKGVFYQESQPTSLGAAASASKNMVTLKFLGELKVLQRIKAKLDACLEVEQVVSPDIHLLFSIIARRKVSAHMDRHIDEENAPRRYFIRWITKKNEFCVYGDVASRAQAIAWLQQMIAELKSLDLVDHVVRIFQRKDPKTGAKVSSVNTKQWLAMAPTAKALYSYFVQSNQCVYVAGSQSQVDAFKQALQAEGMLYVPRKWGAKTGESAKPDCGICYCPAEEPTITLPICNHVYDFDCIQPMIQPATCTFPLTCPAPGCGQPLRVDDASRILNDADAFSSLVETAVLSYVASHKTEALLCPKPGCNQVLSTANVTGSPATDGGRTIYCDECSAHYCLDCTDAMGKPVLRHAKFTCEKFRSRQVSPEIMQHLRAIQEQILNVSCPHCHAVFLDFTGCTSVQCGNATCGHHFCANCLVYSSTSSSETHYHVARCASNPNPASSSGIKGYFTTDEQLAATHRALRTQKLTAYFTDKLKSDAMRCAVYRRLRKDLEDLGVELSIRLQAAHAAEDARYQFGGEEDEYESPADVALRRHVKHVREELLNLRCRNKDCRLVFVDFDFDTCAALTCANPSCGSGICAYCLEPCGKDAHEHVSKCDKNPNRPYYFTTEETFRAVHKERREGEVATYLANVVATKDGAEMVRRVKAALVDDFQSLGLDIAAVGV